jgi:hypothetical protein
VSYLCLLWNVIIMDWLTGEVIIHQFGGLLTDIEFVKPLLQWCWRFSDVPHPSEVLTMDDQVFVTITGVRSTINEIGVTGGVGASCEYSGD